MATQAAASGTETNLGFILEQVAKEKGIDKKILVDTIEAAILKAAQEGVLPGGVGGPGGHHGHGGPPR